VFDDHIGVCGWIDCGDGVTGIDGNADGADGGGEYEHDADCDDGVRAGAGIVGGAEREWDRERGGVE
jgi:hypothetical protein